MPATRQQCSIALITSLISHHSSGPRTAPTISQLVDEGDGKPAGLEWEPNRELGAWSMNLTLTFRYFPPRALGCERRLGEIGACYPKLPTLGIMLRGIACEEKQRLVAEYESATKNFSML